MIFPPVSGSNTTSDSSILFRRVLSVLELSHRLGMLCQFDDVVHEDTHRLRNDSPDVGDEESTVPTYIFPSVPLVIAISLLVVKDPSSPLAAAYVVRIAALLDPVEVLSSEYQILSVPLSIHAM